VFELDPDIAFPSSEDLPGEVILWGAVIFRWYRDLMPEGECANKSFIQHRAAVQFFAHRDYLRDHLCVRAGLSDWSTDYVLKKFEMAALAVVCGTMIAEGEELGKQKRFTLSPTPQKEPKKEKKGAKGVKSQGKKRGGEGRG